MFAEYDHETLKMIKSTLDRYFELYEQGNTVQAKNHLEPMDFLLVASKDDLETLRSFMEQVYENQELKKENEKLRKYIHQK